MREGNVDAVHVTIAYHENFRETVANIEQWNRDFERFPDLILHSLGVRFMQLSYNNQSLLATGCYEKTDPGITLMGRQIIAEMNRVA